MIKLFDAQYKDGVVVDGFVSTTSARVVPFMFKYFHEIYELSKNPNPPTFKFCVLYVNEDNSVRRQIVNYEHQQKGEKTPKSFDAEEGRKLYRKFLKRNRLFFVFCSGIDQMLDFHAKFLKLCDMFSKISICVFFFSILLRVWDFFLLGRIKFFS